MNEDDLLDDTIHIHFMMHIIFSTHNQDPYLLDDEIREELDTQLATICNQLGSTLKFSAISDDHVHLLVEASPHLSTDDLINKIKDRSVNWLRTRGGIYTGFRWQDHYVAVSIDRFGLEEERIKLKNHLKYHKDNSYKEELTEFLNEQGVEWSEDFRK